MLSPSELQKVIEVAKEAGIGKVYLIGSALYGDSAQVPDYDFAVDEVPPGTFFGFYGVLLKSLPKPVDLINLSGRTTKFAEIIRQEGRLLYDRTAG